MYNHIKLILAKIQVLEIKILVINRRDNLSYSSFILTGLNIEI